MVVSHVLNITYVRNVGAAFGLFPGRQPVFMATSLAVLFVIAAFWRRARPTEWPVAVALGLVAAGALGNLIDRAVLGRVTDFFEFGFVQFPVFNVADMAIVFGVGILALWILFGPQPEEPAEEPAEMPAGMPAEMPAEEPSEVQQ
jgi:signal peptidase II